METGTMIAFTATAALFVGLVAWLVADHRKSGELRTRFGPEYDRTLDAYGSRRRAEADLKDREKRVDHLSIRPLESIERKRFSELWRREQQHFVDDPPAAVTEADALVTEVMSARGYPMAEFDQRAADISVDHAAVVENYRAAHAIASRQRDGIADTEDLRRAMIYFRTLFEDLLQGGPSLTPATR